MLDAIDRLLRKDPPQWSDIQPISAEIFGLDRLKQHARSLAEAQSVATRPPRVHSIVGRLEDNAGFLLEAYRELCAAVSEGKAITPAAEWLIDNYHLVEEQVRQTRADLPEGFYRQLPKLADGPLAGHPRIFGLVWGYAAHTDSRFDPDTLTAFVNDYQEAQPLTIGELWAVVINLRLILIENLRRIVEIILKARRDREAADGLAERALGPGNGVTDLSGIFGPGGEPPVTRPFVVQLLRRLRDQDGAPVLLLDWLRRKSEALGFDFDAAINDEHQRQAAANVTVRNIVTSMRFISDVNWQTWFDGVSLVDRLLRQHPLYAEMDFASRTLYRTAVETLARGSARGELEVARLALDTAAAQPDGATSDPGYHVVGPGRLAFQSRLGFREPLWRRLISVVRRARLAAYLGAALLLTAAVVVAGIAPLAAAGIAPAAIALLALLLFLPASEMALAMVNFAATRIVHAAVLPGLALRDGVPEELRTLVAVPTLLTSRDTVEELLERLEVHFLSNAGGEIYFALVTDWGDADAEIAPDDAMLLDAALDGIWRLNQRHDTDRFLLLHRAREWNPRQGKWMGWERKRGKLLELNRLLRGGAATTFIAIGGKLPPDIHYVITLDTDTRLPRDAARRLIGKLAHPLNRAVFDPASRRVVAGYGVLQPRVTPSLPTGHYGSLFQRIFSTTRGIDPYVFAVSDVYQDLFGEGSFAGKGIYDIDAFEAALDGRVPENAMLSHDLFEGVFARAALVTDIEVVEDYPERYGVAAARQHRWIRGDWQLLPWMLGRRGGVSAIPALGLWKMTDNLRRSAVPAASVIALLAGWAFLPGFAALEWTVYVALAGILPPLFPALSAIAGKPSQQPFANRAAMWLEDFAHAARLAAANTVFLAHQAGLAADAIVRTLYRLAASRRNLLEWTTAAQAEANDTPSLARNYSLMAASPGIALAALAIVLWRGDMAGIAAAPFIALWLAAPAIALWLSRSPKLEDELAAAPGDRAALRQVARRTWRYFEEFVTAENRMLPPDNFQETPKPVVAHRTSPTNIGLYLLSVASARQFGWLGLQDAADRIAATLDTLGHMEKHKGHLYNWYDTQTLQPLLPKYVSSVDSGNLAAHLIALANCCAGWSGQPTDGQANLDGIGDVVDILDEDAAALAKGRRKLGPLRKQLDAQLLAFRRAIADARGAPEMMPVKLIQFAVQAANLRTTAVAMAAEAGEDGGKQLLFWAQALRDTIETHFKDASLDVEAAQDARRRLEALAADARRLALAMDFAFLLEPQRNLLSIGYRTGENARDESSYDMLASEARLASFFAIAKGDLRTRHWFRLGRAVTAIKGGAALLSWSGSMFEYLMPSLVLRAPGGGLLDRTAHLVVARQIAYADELGIPWGISESAFNARDVEFTYQYSNFGVPGLGLKRGLAENAVVAPYATGLAAMIAPHAAVANYARIQRLGGRGAYGFYEALDFTPARLPKGESAAIVRAYFAHHQGMTVAAILNAVRNGEMRAWFHDEPMVRAAELLLQERAPRQVSSTYSQASQPAGGAPVREFLPPAARAFHGLRAKAPATQLLSNGHYSVMMTEAGAGFSAWNGLAVTRWREDAAGDDWGSFVYLREPKTGKVWSAGHMPTAAAADSYSAQFSEDKIEITRADLTFTTTLECAVSPEDDAEVRRVTVANSALTSREIEITAYAELVLAPAAADLAHPAFSKLFVETEYVAELETLIATRRRRSPSDPAIWAAQFMLTQGAAGVLEYETDRARFIGVGRSLRAPAALAPGAALSNTTGAVLDPVFALRRRFKVPAGRQVRCTIWTMVADSREAVLDLVDRHRHASAFDRALMLAWTHAQIQLRHHGIDTEEANLFQELASHLIYANAGLRPPVKALAAAQGPQSALWPHGISGDRPIVLLRIDSTEDIDLVRQLLRGFAYWRSKRLAVDVVIVNDRMSSYAQDLQGAIEALVRKVDVSRPAGAAGEAGQIFALRADLLSPETARVLPAAARVVLIGRRGGLAAQLARVRDTVAAPVRREPPKPLRPPAAAPSPETAAAGLEYWNGFGGFGAEGREYVTILKDGDPTPAPWVNVVANPGFGFLVSAAGAGHSWRGNSRENQITGWSNDPVCERTAEAIYVHDEASGLVVSPTLSPMMARDGSHIARHGFGYSVFEREAHDLRLELLQFVPLEDTVKISRLRVSNAGAARRTLAVTFYAEWALGASRQRTAAHIATEIDGLTGAMLARNRWSIAAGGQTAFADLRGGQTAWTGDRREFLGRFGGLAAPLALERGATLSNATGAGLDPCCALQTRIELAPGETREVVMLLGAAPGLPEAQSLIERYRAADIDGVLAGVKEFWSGMLGSVQVKTPDRALDIMLNGWLPYQALACRMWARSGFYQASGAYGFRDQLQDSLAVAIMRPAIAREHLLRAAARQFVEGDVQHWWLPETGMGIRSRISDDVVWLAYCSAHYVKTTGDAAVLDADAPFLEGQALEPGAHDAFFQPDESGERATLYEHCARGLDRALAVGPHGLPLIGTGDWNDGMNRVGEHGKGESVWLGWFLLATLRAFAPFAEARGDAARLAAWPAHATALAAALEADGWDGRWYRRGFYDDGTPLGSAADAECRIDAIAQSWSVISGAADPARARAAMEQVRRQLVLAHEKVALLFTPPFDRGAKDPGYIKAYPPGIRENGGQYSHGAIWSAFAFAALGQGERAAELLSLINPINHALTKEAALKYRIEPYVIAGDVYANPAHTGRGGWSWYTGAAGWMYRAGLEALLGLRREADTLRVSPAIPANWDGYEVSLRHRTARYIISVQRHPDGQAPAQPDVRRISGGEFTIALVGDGETHRIVLRLETRKGGDPA